MRIRLPRRALGALSIFGVTAIVSACGGGGAGVSARAASSPAVSSELQQLIAAATKEGSVTFYSSQLPDNIAAFAKGFEAKFPGIKATGIRMLDTDMPAKIQAEKSHGIADLSVSAAQPNVISLAKAAYFVPATALKYEKQFDPALVYEGGYFEVGAALLVPVWNTDLLPHGIHDYKDFLAPSLAKGQIGLPTPNSASFVDMYLYLEQHYGAGFLQALAAQKPRMYSSTTAAGQAILSGEIIAAPFAPPPNKDKANGAPIDFWTPASIWGARYFGAVLASAPHPHAAQLLAYYMVTPEGQQLVQKGFASIYANIPGTLTSDQNVRKQDVNLLTPDYVAKFAQRWQQMVGR